MSKQKYLIVGAGLFGAVMAEQLAHDDNVESIHIIDKRDHIAGNIFTEKFEDFQIHKYGAHIFHTSDENVWSYVNKFASFNNFINSPIANYKGNIYNLPFNMNTFSQLFGTVYPEDAKLRIEEERNLAKIEGRPKNLEEQAISLVGEKVYRTLIKEYTEKQWGRDCKDLPASIIRRLPVRFTYDNNYFNDKYQGIPTKGYTNIVERMLQSDKITVQLNTLFDKSMMEDYDRVIYTGPMDLFYDYVYGNLEYRSLRFETEVLDFENYQGNAVVNYTSHDEDYTRILEHKHFQMDSKSGKTVITKEYSSEWKDGTEPYYPINDSRNQTLNKKYRALAEKEEKVIFGGRLALYKYFDMDDTIGIALTTAKVELKRLNNI